MIYQSTDSTKSREVFFLFFFPLRINSSGRQIFISILILPIEKNLLQYMSVNLSDQAHKWYKMQEFLNHEEYHNIAKYIKNE